ncbi:MAG: SsrA-binding protein SmpB [Verrucomicrobiota bacterium]
MAKKKQQSGPNEIRNKKLNHKFNVGERFEAGMVLQGTEVKSIRAGDAQINDAFARVEKDNIILYNAHIAEYSFGNLQNHKPTRPRKLLLHRREINRIRAELEAGGKTLIPSRMYLKQGLIKIEICLCTGKKLYDKRETLKTRAVKREAERAMKVSI